MNADQTNPIKGKKIRHFGYTDNCFKFLIYPRVSAFIGG
jgi:hypothetical protein